MKSTYKIRVLLDNHNIQMEVDNSLEGSTYLSVCNGRTCRVTFRSGPGPNTPYFVLAITTSHTNYTGSVYKDQPEATLLNDDICDILKGNDCWASVEVDPADPSSLSVEEREHVLWNS